MPNNTKLIESLIKATIRDKIESRTPESSYMPFHHLLLGRARMEAYSFVHSLNTSFGISLFEPIAKELAKSRFEEVITQVPLNGTISIEAQAQIQKIIDGLSAGKPSDKLKEIETLRKVARAGKTTESKTVRVDLFLRERGGKVHLFDIKTAKPNISSFQDYKRTLLEWVAQYLHAEPDAQLASYIAIPYNPAGDDKPYERWTGKTMLDKTNELKVGRDFWDFLGGEGAYDELLKCFERAGNEVKRELDGYFTNNFPRE